MTCAQVHGGELVLDAALDVDYAGLVLRTRERVPMAPENLGEFQTAAMRELFLRCQALVTPAVAARDALVAVADWGAAPRRTALTLATLLAVEWHVDAAKILAVFPLAAVALLAATLRRRATGAWARAWVERDEERQLICCAGLGGGEGDVEARRELALLRVAARRYAARGPARSPRPRPPRVDVSYAPEARGVRDGAFRCRVATLDLDDGRPATGADAERRPRGVDDAGAANPWLERTKASGRRGSLSSAPRPRRRGSATELLNVAARTNDAVEDVLEPWVARGRVFRRAARYPVLQDLEAAGKARRAVPWSRGEAALVFSLAPGGGDGARPAPPLGECHVRVADLLGSAASEANGGPQPPVDVWLPVGPPGAGDGGSDAADSDSDGGGGARGPVGDVLLTLQVALPSRSDRLRPLTDADRAEQTLIDKLAARVRAADGGDGARPRGLIAEYQALIGEARAQVLESHRQLLRCVSFAESLVNLARWAAWKSSGGTPRPAKSSNLPSSAKSTSIRLIFERIDRSRRALEGVPRRCWVQPRKTALVLAATVAASGAALLLPVQAVLMGGTASFFYDAWIKHLRSLGARGEKRVDERLFNFVRSVPARARIGRPRRTSTRRAARRCPTPRTSPRTSRRGRAASSTRRPARGRRTRGSRSSRSASPRSSTRRRATSSSSGSGATSSSPTTGASTGG